MQRTDKGEKYTAANKQKNFTLTRGLLVCLQGAKALAVPLVTNTSILRLNLRDNWMEGLGGAAIAEMLKENCYITGGFYRAMEPAHIISSLSPPHCVSPFSKKKVSPALPLVRHSHLNYMPQHTVKHLGSLFIFAECQSYGVCSSGTCRRGRRTTPVTHAGSCVINVLCPAPQFNFQGYSNPVNAQYDTV